MYGAGFKPAPFAYADTAALLCCFRFGKVLYGNPLSGFGFDMPPVRHLRYFCIPDKTVVNDDPLGAIFPFTLRFKYFNTVFRRYEGVSPGRYTNTLFNEAKQTYGDFLEENKGLH